MNDARRGMSERRRERRVHFVSQPKRKTRNSIGAENRLTEEDPSIHPRFSLINILGRLRLVTGSSVPVLWLAKETLVQCVGGCSIRVAEKTCSSRCACDFSSGSGGRARDSVRAAAPAHSPPIAERKAPRTPPLVEPARSCRVPRERLGGAWPSAERSMPARPPLLETVETVEAPQPPGRMALRQHANGAAFPSRSRGERALLHGRGEASLTLKWQVFSHSDPDLLH